MRRNANTPESAAFRNQEGGESMNPLEIDKALCKGCRLCVTVCPAKALRDGTERNSMGYIVPDVRQEACTGCSSCAIVCPDMAISIHKRR